MSHFYCSNLMSPFSLGGLGFNKLFSGIFSMHSSLPMQVYSLTIFFGLKSAQTFNNYLELIT